MAQQTAVMMEAANSKDALLQRYEMVREEAAEAKDAFDDARLVLIDAINTKLPNSGTLAVPELHRKFPAIAGNYRKFPKTSGTPPKLCPATWGGSDTTR